MRVVHYLNQFFGGLGGEDQAGASPTVQAGSVGPGRAIEAVSNGELTIVGTVICGDNYFSERTAEATAAVLAHIAELGPDVVVAGPAFNAGRYGVACAEVCKAVQAQLNIPAVTAMYQENPGVALARSGVLIARTTESVVGMRDAVEALVRLATKLGRGEALGLPAVEGYVPRGLRRNAFDSQDGATRAVEMLLKKLHGEPFETELPLPTFDRVASPPPLRSAKAATVALATEAGIVPKGNPDRLPSGWSTRWFRYPIEGVDDLTADTYQAVHYGWDNQFTNQDPDRMVPLDALRQLEREDRVGQIADHYWVTAGGGTTIENSIRMGQEMAADLKASGVQGVIFTAT